MTIEALPFARTRIDYRYNEPQGPTPTFVHLGRELDRLSNVWGTADRGWAARCDGGDCELPCCAPRVST